MPRTAGHRQPSRTTQSPAVAAGAVGSCDEAADGVPTLEAGAAPARSPTSGDRLRASGVNASGEQVLLLSEQL